MAFLSWFFSRASYVYLGYEVAKFIEKRKNPSQHELPELPDPGPLPPHPTVTKV